MNMLMSLSALVMLTSAFVAGQRPSFAGTRPIGFPETPNKTTTTPDPLGNRFGEGTTQRLPLEANGDRDLVDRLSKLPIDKQPFWFINWQALEENRKNPQTYPQRPNVFVDPSSNTGSINNVFSTPNSDTGLTNRFSSSNSNSNAGTSNTGFSTSNSNAGTSNNRFSTSNSNAGTVTNGLSTLNSGAVSSSTASAGNTNNRFSTPNPGLTNTNAANLLVNRFSSTTTSSQATTNVNLNLALSNQYAGFLQNKDYYYGQQYAGGSTQTPQYYSQTPPRTQK